MSTLDPIRQDEQRTIGLVLAYTTVMLIIYHVYLADDYDSNTSTTSHMTPEPDDDLSATCVTHSTMTLDGVTYVIEYDCLPPGAETL